jgi:hypothetical protein
MEYEDSKVELEVAQVGKDWKAECSDDTEQGYQTYK